MPLIDIPINETTRIRETEFGGFEIVKASRNPETGEISKDNDGRVRYKFGTYHNTLTEAALRCFRDHEVFHGRAVKTVKAFNRRMDQAVQEIIQAMMPLEELLRQEKQKDKPKKEA